jgi:hypothetical protein
MKESGWATGIGLNYTGLRTSRGDSLQFRLQNISTTGVDSRGLEGTAGDSIDGEKRLGIEVLREKSCAINQLVD